MTVVSEQEHEAELPERWSVRANTRHMFGAAFHEGRSLLGSMDATHFHGSSKRRALNMR